MDVALEQLRLAAGQTRLQDERQRALADMQHQGQMQQLNAQTNIAYANINSRLQGQREALQAQASQANAARQSQQQGLQQQLAYRDLSERRQLAQRQQELSNQTQLHREDQTQAEREKDASLWQQGHQFDQSQAQQDRQFNQTGASREWEAEQNRDFQAEHAKFSAAHEDAARREGYDQQENMAAVNAQAHAWLTGQDLSQQEQMRLQRLQTGVGSVMADPHLTPEEKSQMVLQLRTGIDPLAERMKATQQRHMEQQNKLVEDQHAHNVAMEEEARKYRAKNIHQKFSQYVSSDGRIIDVMDMGPDKPPHILQEHVKEGATAGDRQQETQMKLDAHKQELATKQQQHDADQTRKEEAHDVTTYAKELDTYHNVIKHYQDVMATKDPESGGKVPATADKARAAALAAGYHEPMNPDERRMHRQMTGLLQSTDDPRVKQAASIVRNTLETLGMRNPAIWNSKDTAPEVQTAQEALAKQNQPAPARPTIGQAMGGGKTNAESWYITPQREGDSVTVPNQSLGQTGTAGENNANSKKWAEDQASRIEAILAARKKKSEEANKSQWRPWMH